jgi:hypothetical protein
MVVPSFSDLSYSTPGPVALGQLNSHPVASVKPDEMGAEAIGDMSEDLDPVHELDPEHAVGKRFENDPVDQPKGVGGLGHERLLYLNSV